MRSKLLVENVIFFGFLRIVSSLLPFLILPIIVRYLPNPEDFGSYDNYTIIVSVFSSIAALGSFDAMFREFFNQDQESYRRSVIKTGLILVLAACTILSGFAIIFKTQLAEVFFDRSDYAYLILFVIISLFVQSLNRAAISPSKMVNNKKHIFYHTMIYAILFYLLSLVMLELGYGFISLIYAQLISFVSCLLIFGTINRNYFIYGHFEWKIAKTLLKIGLPLVPIFIIYWANNAVARIFIVDHLGTEKMGVFALGSRYAAISSLLQIAFAGGWSYFTFSTMKDDDHVAMKSKIFKYLVILIALFYYSVGLVYEPFFEYTFAKEYQSASLVFPALFLAPLLLILYQIVANQFTIIGKSYFSLLALLCGLIVNVIIGYNGAAVAKSLQMTAASIPIGYFISVIGVSFLGVRYNVLKIDVTTIFTLLAIVLLFYLQYQGGSSMRLTTSIVIAGVIFFNIKILLESLAIVNRLFAASLRSKK